MWVKKERDSISSAGHLGKVCALKQIWVKKGGAPSVMEIVSPLSGESSTKSGLDDLATSAEQLMLNPPANGLGLVHASGEKHLIDMPTFPTLLHFLGWMTTRRIPPAELSDSVHGLTVLDAQNSQFAASITEGSSLAGLVTGLGQLYGAGLWATNDLSLHLLNVIFEQLSTELQAARQSATHRAHLIELEDTVLDYGNSMSTLGRDDLNAISGNGAEVLIPILDPVAQFDSGMTEQHLSSVDEVIDEVNLLPPDEHVNSLLDSGMIVNPDTASSSAAGTGPVAKRRGRPKKAATPLTVSTVRAPLITIMMATFTLASLTVLPVAGPHPCLLPPHRRYYKFQKCSALASKNVTSPRRSLLRSAFDRSAKTELDLSAMSLLNSMNRLWFILSWNIRGINRTEKWPLIRNKIEESNASIICFQETKRGDFDLSFIRKFAPRRFDNFAFVPSDGASGGLLVLWASNLFSGQVILQESFGLVIEFISHSNAEKFTLVNIYGPCEGTARENFVAWLFHLDIPDDSLWILVGDFNFYRYAESRNKPGANFEDIETFNEIISYLGLIELPIKGRAFTWSNMQNEPLLEQLDWFFTSHSWTIKFPNTEVKPLARPTSDHIPCVVTIGTSIPKAQVFRFENHWVRMPGFLDVVQTVWDINVPGDSAKCLSGKFKLLRKALKKWSTSISVLNRLVDNCNSIILRLDEFEEMRPLHITE
jgi:exonuclease III